VSASSNGSVAIKARQFVDATSWEPPDHRQSNRKGGYFAPLQRRCGFSTNRFPLQPQHYSGGTAAATRAERLYGVAGILGKQIRIEFVVGLR
jgi:hypothetical protein